MTQIDLKGLSAAEMEAWAVAQGLGAYRGRQIRHWVLTRFVESFDDMGNLPKTLRTL
jgi:23S rRNA (adenine2503-C2)-methyltransferase